MAHSAVVFNVFIASPSDVYKERQLVRQVLADWNATNVRPHGVVLQPMGWETDSYPALGQGPQDEINRQLLEDADLLIGVFWTRIGTPTPQHESGSVEEIKRHHAAGKPVMLYFSDQPVKLDSVDQDQYGKLRDFKSWCSDRGIIESFSSDAEFVEKLRRQLDLRVSSDGYFSQFLKDKPPSEDVEGPPPERGIVSRLSEDSIQLLTEAAKDSAGTIMCLHVRTGLVAQTNGKSFGSERGDPRVNAALEDALSTLESEGLISAVSYKREIFRVTALGYKVADAINRPQA